MFQTTYAALSGVVIENPAIGLHLEIPTTSPVQALEFATQLSHLFRNCDDVTQIWAFAADKIGESTVLMLHSKPESNRTN